MKIASFHSDIQGVMSMSCESTSSHAATGWSLAMSDIVQHLSKKDAIFVFHEGNV